MVKTRLTANSIISVSKRGFFIFFFLLLGDRLTYGSHYTNNDLKEGLDTGRDFKKYFLSERRDASLVWT